MPKHRRRGWRTLALCSRTSSPSTTLIRYERERERGDCDIDRFWVIFSFSFDHPFSSRNGRTRRRQFTLKNILASLTCTTIHCVNSIACHIYHHHIFLNHIMTDISPLLKSYLSFQYQPPAVAPNHDIIGAISLAMRPRLTEDELIDLSLGLEPRPAQDEICPNVRESKALLPCNSRDT